jgi:hypothetical protein
MPGFDDKVQQTKSEEELKTQLFKNIAAAKQLALNAERLRALINNPHHTASKDQIDNLLEHLDHNSLIAYFKLIEDRSNIYHQLVARKTQLETAVRQLLNLCQRKIAKLEAQEKPIIPDITFPIRHKPVSADSTSAFPNHIPMPRADGSTEHTYTSLSQEIKAKALAERAKQAQCRLEDYETTRQKKLTYFKALKATLIDKSGEAQKSPQQKISSFSTKLKRMPEELNIHRDTTDDSFFAKAANILRKIKNVLNNAFSSLTGVKATLFKSCTDSAATTEKMQNIVREVLPAKPQC